jgi:hypothetical protein
MGMSPHGNVAACSCTLIILTVSCAGTRLARCQRRDQVRRDRRGEAGAYCDLHVEAELAVRFANMFAELAELAELAFPPPWGKAEGNELRQQAAKRLPTPLTPLTRYDFHLILQPIDARGAAGGFSPRNTRCRTPRWNRGCKICVVSVVGWFP